MVPWPLLLKIAAIKNSVSLFLVNPVSRHIIHYGRKVPTIFYPTCRGITHTYQVGQKQVYRAAGWKHTPKELTTEYIEQVGGKFITWVGLTGLITGGVLFAHTRRKKRKEKN